jgi:dTDP-4-amino-4,6-dideoxygalactose transaminase
MVRNHGEVILQGQTVRSYNSVILGWNYRMTEMEAALGIVQFGKMDALNQQRIDLANYLSEKLQMLDGLQPPIVHEGTKHVYYVYALKYDAAVTGIPRDLFVRALNAEGIPFGAGYVRPLYLSSLYHDRRPFAFRHYEGKATYEKGLCPTAERLYEQELILTAVVRPPATFADMDDVANAIGRVLENREALIESVSA